ncbi:amino acid/amide ABC transporter substrate-binding protein, HAAT family [Arboricoccus pini]|uniref:Amino acid/amide ABC transporter substrate-binding protein, HAAT family n=2 Tax=Arboricoccus pini TaxID=1963835 RepID=A0A212RHR9_9PROT|nr:amino acid/amide ABC transporter substrate-binding protein, HAAT family [Arboricoccus pini]
MMHRKWAGIAAIAAMLALNPVQGRAADDIVMGFAVATSGDMAAYDGDSTKMAQLWIDQTNAKGGLLGKQLKAVMADTKSDRVEGAKAGQRVVHDGAALVFATCDYDFGAPAALQAQQAKIMSVFLCAGDPKAGVMGVGPFSFTSSNAAQVEGATMAQWGMKKKQFKTAYVILDESLEYNKSACAGFDWAYPKVGGTIVGRDTFKGADTSLASQITRFRGVNAQTKVDVIMLCSSMPGAGSALRQIRGAGIDIPVFGSQSMDGLYWQTAVPNLKDFYVPIQASSYGDDPRPEVNALTKAYAEKYGSAPASQYAYPIYAWLDLWGKAVTKAGTTDAAAVTKVMESYKDEPTLLGPRTFTNKLHIQDQPLELIAMVGSGKGQVIDQWRIDEPVPPAVLYRLKTN